MLRGGYRTNPAMRVDSSQEFLNAGKRTSLQLLNIRVRSFLASQAHAMLEAIDADVPKINRCRQNNSTGSVPDPGNVVHHESNHYQQNNVTGNGAIIKVTCVARCATVRLPTSAAAFGFMTSVEWLCTEFWWQQLLQCDSRD